MSYHSYVYDHIEVILINLDPGPLHRSYPETNITRASQRHAAYIFWTSCATLFVPL